VLFHYLELQVEIPKHSPITQLKTKTLKNSLHKQQNKQVTKYKRTAPEVGLSANLIAFAISHCVSRSLLYAI